MAIQGSQRHQIVLAVVEWASANSQRVVVPWTVLGRPGAFVIAVEEFESFSYALVAKIVREVADERPTISVASVASARH